VLLRHFMKPGNPPHENPVLLPALPFQDAGVSSDGSQVIEGIHVPPETDALGRVFFVDEFRQIQPFLKVSEFVQAAIPIPECTPVRVRGVLRDQAGVAGIGLELLAHGRFHGGQITHGLLPVVLAQ
jgi:hypothetical protein